MDIEKAYDTVDWGFLKEILQGFGFHEVMIQWIMICVTTTSFSISVNGNLHAYFRGKRGIRQGGPMSPYLFTLVMEVLTLMIRRRVHLSNNFQYHSKCAEQKIINLCFADDLFLFSSAHMDSIRVISGALEEFKNCFGLVLSMAKSMTFFVTSRML
ncbi:secreted RxLR effector protein 78-like [Rutidosis leptorrhynchoides]|uniref:secreted RxLR effector protein 78-like n=1 Tax=Rutidosis leptorrhynchoides TaxID=125765 RepID=UPI003A995871